MAEEQYHQYTTAELNADLLLFIEMMKGHDQIFDAYFQDLYNTGLRAMELAQIYSRLYKLGQVWYLKLEKGSADRQIDLTTLSYHAQLCIALGREPYFTVTHSRIKGLFRTFYPHKPVFSEGKIVTSHLFRHAFVKRLYAAGLDITTISKMIGEKVEANTQHYADSVLMYRV